MRRPIQHGVSHAPSLLEDLGQPLHWRVIDANSAIGFKACTQQGCSFVPGTVEGSRIVLRPNDAAEVTHVPLVWADAPYVNLHSGDGLPAVPFDLPVPPGDRFG